MEQTREKIINLRLRAVINMLFLFFVVIAMIAAQSRCAPSADIMVNVEIDYMDRYKTDQSLANHYLIEITKNESGRKKAIKDVWDERGMPVIQYLTLQEFINLANEHDNLSENNDWWVYILGAKYLATLDLGYTDFVGSIYSSSDNNHSVIAVQSITDIYDDEDEEEALQAQWHMKFYINLVTMSIVRTQNAYFMLY